MYNTNNWFVIWIHQEAKLLASFEEFGMALDYLTTEPLEEWGTRHLINSSRQVYATRDDAGLRVSEAHTYFKILDGGMETNCPRNCHGGCVLCGIEIGQFVGPSLEEVIDYAQSPEAWHEKRQELDHTLEDEENDYKAELAAEARGELN